ncbi:putative membrane protein, DUF368 family [Halapricum desulfuricans]|uniref:Putative membrane protein, DUF368 family n=1 Tax=Halapricum desulfuricans TaxID=2841257 RepID=A0A897NCB3_9EURY|nr:DUF368 domain-containing protein [Halapricum desulfuricans]QSG12060.1 putative membrane protein, DUF368 family [Halapricum desulfuricans]
MIDDSQRHAIGDTPLYSWLSVYLKGIAMGMADSIPGVSGGTIAFITGIYERLITAITNLDPNALALLGGLGSSSGRRRLYERLVEMDVPFLVVLGTGIVTAVVAMSRVVYGALQQAPGATFAFFFGLIAASAIVLYDQLSLGTPARVAAAVAGFALAFLVSGVTAGADGIHTLPIVFVSGAIAIVAMILPGVSGAFFLVLLGQYEYLTGTLTAFVDGAIAVLLGDRSIASLLDPATTVVTFVGGAVIGVVTVAHAIRWALNHYRAATLSFLVSLMVGALRLPVIEMRANVEAFSLAAVSPLTLAVLAGGGAVLVLDHYTDDLSY